MGENSLFRARIIHKKWFVIDVVCKRLPHQKQATWTSIPFVTKQKIMFPSFVPVPIQFFFFGRALTNSIDRIAFGDVFRFYQRNCLWICILNRICLLNRRCCCQTKYCIVLISYSVCDSSASQWSLHRWHSVSRIANNNLVWIIRDGIRITETVQSVSEREVCFHWQNACYCLALLKWQSIIYILLPVSLCDCFANF